MIPTTSMVNPQNETIHLPLGLVSLELSKRSSSSGSSRARATRRRAFLFLLPVVLLCWKNYSFARGQEKALLYTVMWDGSTTNNETGAHGSVQKASSSDASFDVQSNLHQYNNNVLSSTTSSSSSYHRPQFRQIDVDGDGQSFKCGVLLFYHVPCTGTCLT